MPYFETRTRHLDDRQKYVLEKFPPPKDKLTTTQAEYRYDVQGAPRQMDDALIVAMKRVVRQLNKTHMLRCIQRASVQHGYVTSTGAGLDPAHQDLRFQAVFH